ncbi:MAG TPA: cation:proton antiporter [Bryobacteraceae bacterium]|nr:cation:proton antiporter [Bryobacteraceae bacterium]
MPNLFHLVLQIAAILMAARVVGFLFQKINQPQVIGEMVAGILLGPSLLGWVAPGVSAALFPPQSLGYLNALSQIGLVVFMFVVGLALDPTELKGYGHAAVLTSHVSIVAPFCLGGLTALYLYPRLSDDGVTFSGFALFMGSAMSITAFPVLARILSERGLVRSRMGTLAIACAAVDDITGWCILAYIVVLVRVTQAGRPAWVTMSGSLLYVLTMIFVVRRFLPAFERAYRKRDRLSDNLVAVIVILLLASALATEWLGIHLLFGAFLMGAIMPKTPDFTRYLLHKFESVIVVLLLPLFFAFTGLRTRIGVGGGSAIWFYSALVIVAAITGKLGGSMLAARLSGMPWRDSAALGVLMNTRGLMELVILNIGLDIGVISPAMFSIMVLMALVTTFMTTPLLEWIYPSRLLQAQVNEIHKNVA